MSDYSSKRLAEDIAAIGNKQVDDLRMEYLSWEDARSANAERGNEKAESYCLAMIQAITYLTARAEAEEKRCEAIAEYDEAGFQLGLVIGKYINDEEV